MFQMLISSGQLGNTMIQRIHLPRQLFAPRVIVR